MKASLAAALGAVKALREAEVPLAGDLLVSAVADEENASLGTRDLLGHGSDPGSGVDASLRMGRVVAGIEALAADLAGRPAHPRLGPPSVHAPLVEGGVGISTCAPRCTLRVERRILPGETARDARAEVEAILDRLQVEDPSFEASVETVVFGSAGAGAHADEEWVDTDPVLRLAEVPAGTAIRYCGTA